MFRFEIPKEIKTQVRLLGLELKEWAVIGIVIVFSLTVFSDMIHKVFVIPFYIVVALSILYLFSPSSTNPQRKNYQSLFYFIKRERSGYLSVNTNEKRNRALKEIVLQNNREKERSRIKGNVALDSDGSEKEQDSYFSEVEFRDGSYHFINKEMDDVDVEKNDGGYESESLIEGVDSVKSDENKDVYVEKYEGDESVDSNSHVDNLHLKKEDKQGYLRIRKDDSSKTLLDYEKEKENEGGSNRKMRFSSRFLKVIAIAVTLFIAVGGLFLFLRLDSGFLAEEEIVVDEEVLVSALRSFSLKDYDEAMLLFDQIDYEALEDDDKDVMLLTYLFGDDPKVALELEPEFDEVVASYYKASHSMQKIRDLSDDVDSNVLDFEIAVSDRDYEKIIGLKEFVQIKDERGEKIVEAFIETEQISEAKEFIEEMEDEDEKVSLGLMVEEFEYTEKNKKKAKKKKEKGDK